MCFQFAHFAGRVNTAGMVTFEEFTSMYLHVLLKNGSEMKRGLVIGVVVFKITENNNNYFHFFQFRYIISVN